MDNEINLFDMLLAKKLGGGGSVSPVVFTATQWSELPAIDRYEFFPATIGEDIALGVLSFTFSGVPVTVPIFCTGAITGGASSHDGTGATIILYYDTTDLEWKVSKAWTNIMGSWTDITAAVQSGASDIELKLYK